MRCQRSQPKPRSPRSPRSPRTTLTTLAPARDTLPIQTTDTAGQLAELRASVSTTHSNFKQLKARVAPTRALTKSDQSTPKKSVLTLAIYARFSPVARCNQCAFHDYCLTQTRVNAAIGACRVYCHPAAPHSPQARTPSDAVRHCARLRPPPNYPAQPAPVCR